MNPLSIAVIIATVDRADSIKNALKSIERQTIQPKEIIIIDSSKSNETQLACLDSEMADRIHYEWQPRNGISHAKNAGLKIASQEFVFFLDDDVVLEKNYFEATLAVFEKFQDAVGVQGHYTVSGVD